jgi:hypothetical protein
LAQWKDGSLRYLMGRLQHQGATSDEDRYRCFVYEKIQPPPSSSSLLLPGGSGSPPAPAERHRPVTILLAQSGDATCSGLTSPTEGSRTLKLTKGKSDQKNLIKNLINFNAGGSQTRCEQITYKLKKNQTKTQEIESLKEKSGQEYNETAREKEKLMDGEKRI